MSYKTYKRQERQREKEHLLKGICEKLLDSSECGTNELTEDNFFAGDFSDRKENPLRFCFTEREHELLKELAGGNFK